MRHETPKHVQVDILRVTWYPRVRSRSVVVVVVVVVVVAVIVFSVL